MGCYVTVGDGGNYVTFHELNVHIKIKKIKAQSDRVSNREFFKTHILKSAVTTAPWLLFNKRCPRLSAVLEERKICKYGTLI